MTGVCEYTPTVGYRCTLPAGHPTIEPHHVERTPADTTPDIFCQQAGRLADDIDNEIGLAAGDPRTLADIARAATRAVDQVAGARRRAEDAWFAARATTTQEIAP